MGAATYNPVVVGSNIVAKSAAESIPANHSCSRGIRHAALFPAGPSIVDTDWLAHPIARIGPRGGSCECNPLYLFESPPPSLAT